MRGGTVYWTGNATATPPTLVRTDARHVTRGPFQQKVYRIGKDRSNNAVGVFLYCQQHAREWVTPITCVETAERLVTQLRDGPDDEGVRRQAQRLHPPVGQPRRRPRGVPRELRPAQEPDELLPDHGNPPAAPAAATPWGVDLNRNNTVGTLFDGYDGASTSCTSETFTGPAEASEPEIKNEHWVADTFKGIKFANNIHTHGGYFMWAPGAYKDAGRVTLPAPNIGIENYFFDVADTILSHIRSSRNTAILPQRVGPIADMLYSAAGNSSDEGYYKRGIIGYSFEAGAQRITVNETTGAITRTAVGFQPCFAGPGHQRRPGLDLHHGHPARAEPAAGQRGPRLHDGVRRGQLRHDPGCPRVPRGRHRAGDDDRVLGRADERRPDQLPVQLGRRARGHLLHDRRLDPVVVPDDKTTEINESCANTAATGTRCYNNQGPRMPGEVLTLGLGAHTVKWMAVDIKGNREAVKSQRLLVAADDADGTVGGTVPATLGLSLGTRGLLRAVHPGRAEGLHGRHDRQRHLDGRQRDAVRLRRWGQPGPPDERHVQDAAAAPGDRLEPGRGGRRRWHGRRRGARRS